MFMKKYMSRISVLLVLLAFGSTTVWANDVSRCWYKTRYTTTTEETIVGWNTKGTNKLCVDNDGAGEADVSCDTVLVKSGSTAENWTYDNGDDIITTSYELSNCLISMLCDEREYKNCAITSLTIAGNSYAGLCQDVWVIITQYADDSTYVHEIGHVAGLDDIMPTVDYRIMNYIASDGDDNRVIQSEANAYEDL